MSTELQAAMDAKLAQAGIPYHDLKVFGAIRCNVHVRCIGFQTAHKWIDLLHQVFPGEVIKCVDTLWDAAENKNTVMRPTKVKGYLVAVAA